MPAPRKDYSEAVRLYESGMSAPKVAQLVGIATSGIYLVLKRRGVKIRPLRKQEICSVPNCGCRVKARGLCDRHVAQFYNHGEIISIEKLKAFDGSRKCSVPGCGRKHRSNGYCNGHLGQYRKHGRIISETLAPRDGKSQHSNGYVLILKPGHPAANHDGYVKRANLVWEENTGQIVIFPALVHHKNGKKDDDSFDNLEYFSSDFEHQKAHHVRMGIRGFIPGGIF